MYIRLMEHIKKNAILVAELFQFQAKSTTEKAIHSLIHEILKVLNDKSIVWTIFYGLSKALDCVNHNILLSRLKCYGITGKANALLKSFLP
jgi:hypothetical protein